MFDAWLHTECNLTFQDAASYSSQELQRLQLGWALRNQEGESRESKRAKGRKARAREQFVDSGAVA